jgi:serine/threonine-protein kinase
MTLTAGNTLQHGKYLINHILGHTDIGLTLQGTQVQQRRSVILKILKQNPKLGLNASQFKPLKQRFFEQVQRFAHCNHPGLVRLIDSFEEEESAIAVLDYTPGDSLRDVVNTRGKLAESEAIQYVQQIGSALTELHNHGLIHRAIAPNNVIRPAGSNIVVLVNIGLLDPIGLGSNIQVSVGEYAAIEQYQTQLAHTPATDIYGLAGTLYFLLTGHAPLAAPLRHRSPLPPPRQLRPQLTPGIESAILQGLELNTNSRPQSVADWLALLPPLIGWAGHPPHAALPVSEPNPAPVTSAPSPIPFSSQSHQSMASSNFALKTTFPQTLLAVATIAAAIGLGTGLSLRIAANSTGPGTSIFHAEQAFPPFENWPGVAQPSDPSTFYSNPAVETPAKPEVEIAEPQRTEKTPVLAPTVVPETIQTPVPETPVPSELAPLPSTEPSPTPDAIAPPPPPAPIYSEPPPPPAAPPPAEVIPEPAPPSLSGASGSSEVQRQ